MSDTVKLKRPSVARRNRGPSGRVEHDARGNAVWVSTRATDGKDLKVDASLAIVEDPPKKAARTLRPTRR